MTGPDTTVVLGGGLAGITAAIDLADAGHAVTLVEGRPRLGGATYSFGTDTAVVDTGQHVFLRCYTAYRALLDRLGTARLAPVQRRLSIPVLTPGSTSVLRLHRDRLPAPLHLARTLAGFDLLGPAERARTAAAAAALSALDLDDPALDAQSFGDWLTEHGVGAHAQQTFWDLVVRATLNGAPRQVSLALAAFVFRRGLLDSAEAGDLGVPQVPLAALHGEPATRLLSRLGVRVLTRTRARSVHRDDAGFRIRTETAELAADRVVVALPHADATRVLAELPEVAGARWAGLGAAPIVNVHLHLAHRVTHLPFAAVAGSPVQFFFDRTRAAGVLAGQWLTLSVSAAQPYVDRPVGELRELFVPALADVLPGVARTEIRQVLITRERRATFAQAPGTAALRPAARTGVPGLVLAGAWTRTGWPDTMEGAVRSGHTAALLARAHRSGVGPPAVALPPLSPPVLTA